MIIQKRVFTECVAHCRKEIRKMGSGRLALTSCSLRLGFPRERDAEVRFCAGSLVRSALRNKTCKRLRKAGLGRVRS